MSATGLDRDLVPSRVMGPGVTKDIGARTSIVVLTGRTTSVPAAASSAGARPPGSLASTGAGCIPPAAAGPGDRFP
jgi:hypothetical protein